MKSINLQIDSPTLTKVQETFRIANEIFQHLDAEAISDLMGGYEEDIERIADTVILETFDVCFNNPREIKDNSLQYLERLTTSVEEQLRIESLAYFTSSVFPEFEMSWHHYEWAQIDQVYNRYVLLAARDHGKCFGKGTRLQKFNGDIVNVEDIKVGDLLLGPDFKPRKVISTHTGESLMYTVKPKDKEFSPYRVNKEHILCLLNIEDHILNGRPLLQEIPAKIYYRKEDWFKLNSYLYKAGVGKDTIKAASKFNLVVDKVDEYFGFSLEEEDKRCLLEDGQVVHNSYFFSNVGLIWRLYRYQGKNSQFTNRRDLTTLGERGFLMTYELGLAQDLLEIVKNNIQDNPILNERLRPAKNSDSWNKTDIRTKNGARLSLKSFGSSFRGRHPGWIRLDDFLDDNALYSKSQREKAKNFFDSVIMNAVLPGGSVGLIGTPFHSEDLYAHVRKNNKDFFCFEYPSIMPDGSPLWEGRYSLRMLLNKKSAQGNIVFSREHLVKPITADSSIFPYELISRAFYKMEEYTLVNNRESFPIKFEKVVVGCDFAMSSSVGADYSAYGVWGIDEKDRMWLLHLFHEKGKSYGEQMSVLRKINFDFRPDVFYFEANQFQMIFAEEATKEGLPVFPHITNRNKYDLKSGLPSVALLLERDMIKLPRGDEYSRHQTDKIATELASIAWTDKGLEGVGAHDDLGMMVWISSVAARHINTGFGIEMF